MLKAWAKEPINLLYINQHKGDRFIGQHSGNSKGVSVVNTFQKAHPEVH